MDCRSASGSASRTPTPPGTPCLTSVQWAYRHLRQSSLPLCVTGFAATRADHHARRNRPARVGKLAPPDHGVIAGSLPRGTPWVSSGFSRSLGDERTQQWSEGLCCHTLGTLSCPSRAGDRQGERHLTLALFAVVFIPGHGCSSGWLAPRPVTVLRRLHPTAFRQAWKQSMCTPIGSPHPPAAGVTAGSSGRAPSPFSG